MNGVCKERSCQLLHRGEHRGDCHYWKQGDCRYSEEECSKGKHRHEMYDYYRQQGGQVRQQGGLVAPPAPPAHSSAAAPSAPFFGGGQGGAVPPPGAMSTEAMLAMMQYISAELSARRPGQ